MQRFPAVDLAGPLCGRHTQSGRGICDLVLRVVGPVYPLVVPGKEPVSKREPRNNTKLILTLAAERVFATHGIAGATLKEIRCAAGQRNESAIHYHFGSREAVLHSILELRTVPINRMRLRLLDEARAQSPDGKLSTQQIVDCFLDPLADFLFESDQQTYYLRFLWQLAADRQTWRRVAGGNHDRGLQQCLAALVQTKAHLPRTIVERRYANLTNQMIAALASIEQVRADKPGAFEAEQALMRVEDLRTTGVAQLDAPLSERAARLAQTVTRTDEIAASLAGTVLG